MLFSTKVPTVYPLTAGFRQRADYQGSIHDDTSAQKFGYDRALVPGVVLAGNLTDLVARNWGEAWVAQGTLDVRSRRPVYDGDHLCIHAGPVVADLTGKRVSVEIRDTDGRAVVTGVAEWPAQPDDIPDPAQFPVLPIPDPLRQVGPGGFRPGDRYGCAPMTVDQTHQDEARAMFGLGWTGFLDGIIAPVVYTRLAAQNALASYALPTPSIFVSARTRALGLAQTGAKITTSGQVTEVYERNGHHYTDQVHLVFADDRPVALVHRTSIYVARAAGKA